MRRHALLVLVLGWLVAVGGLAARADTPENQAIRQDRKQYEGTWRVVALEVNGVKASEADARTITVTNQVDGTWIVTVEGKEVGKGGSKIDPMQNPKAIDFMPTEGANAGQTFLGVYTLEGDLRQLCFAPAGKDRPAAFSSRPGSEHVWVVCRREKK